MHRAVLLIFAINVLLVSAAAVAQIQSGSTGGTIGKQDKSMSGATPPDESSPPTSTPKPHSPVAVANPRQLQTATTKYLGCFKENGVIQLGVQATGRDLNGSA
jgi:hypothetical protein